MKIILLSVILLAGRTVLAQDAAPTNAASASTAQDEKGQAMAINKELMDIDGYQKQFGLTSQTTHNVVVLRNLELRVAKKSGNEARFDALVQKLAADPQPEVAALATKLAALKSKPVHLRFIAVDGRHVDLASLRGKVVLIDFWATWCGPCVGEVPHVVEAYKKYQGQGFEIVGISLDQDKDALTAFTHDHGMTWPQYFDGKGWKNDISSGFGINSIPAMWLVDKHGMLATMNGRDDLAGQVAKLLAAP